MESKGKKKQEFSYRNAHMRPDHKSTPEVIDEDEEYTLPEGSLTRLLDHRERSRHDISTLNERCEELLNNNTKLEDQVNLCLELITQENSILRHLSHQTGGGGGAERRGKFQALLTWEIPATV